MGKEWRWQRDTEAVVVGANDTVWFRGIDAAGNISEVTRFTVTNIDKVAPTKPTASADITSPTNQSVTVTATFSSDTATRQYSLNNSTWQTYTEGIVMSANGSVWFRGIDAAGNISEVTSYTVTNIDKVAPTKPTASADITSLTNLSVTVTATFSSDTVTKQYSLNNSAWQTYTAGVVMSANGTVWFRGIDAAGNVSIVTSYEVTNIIEPSDELTVFNLSATPTKTVVQGTAGDDLFNLSANGTWGTYHIAQWNGGESVVGIAGRNRYYDALNGAGGYDAIQLAVGDNAVFYSDLLSPKATDADAAARLAGISEIRGGDGRDVIDMTAAAGSYSGGLLLNGGAGDDHLWAGAGNDVLIGGAGDDDLRGGAGDDLYLFGTDWGADTIVDDGGTLVFDSSLEGTLELVSDGGGTLITHGADSVSLSWGVTADDIRFADVGELSNYRLQTIRAMLA